jgi:hypothetical protein
MAKNVNVITPPSFFDKMEASLLKKEELFFWLFFIITALVSFLLYDPRISLSGDDSTYIIQAHDFIKHFVLPNFQGPLYPVALSPVVLLFGISLFPLKVFSLLSMLGFMYFTFITFRKRIPASILLPVLLLVSINSSVLYYASQTFSEAFYMLIQSLFIFVFFRFFVENQTNKIEWKTDLKHHLYLALLILATALTRSVGFAVLIGVAGYFLIQKQWKNLGFIILSFACIFIIYSLLKTWIWGSSDLQFSTQGNSLLNKNFYRPEEGKEDLVGLLVRFWQNSVQYLSNGLLRIMGFQYPVGENSAFQATLVYILAITGLYSAFKKNKYLTFTIVITGVFLIVTFIALQVFWNQERLIIPVYPFILLSIFTFFYYLLSLKKLRGFQFLYLLPIAILFIMGAKNTLNTIPEARKITNQYSGLSPDWVNYMKASDWAAKNLKENDLVACRKPSISTIYGNGKSFYGIYNVPTGDSKTFLQEWTDNPNKYVAVIANEQNYKFYDPFLRNYYRARIEIGNGVLWAFNRSSDLDTILTQNNIQNVQLQQFKEISTQVNDNFGIFYADSLLNQLKTGNATHIMTANLRSNPNMKTGQTISTVERYAFYIQEKYPNIYEFVYQEGGNDNEPAKIYKINWGVLNEK